MNNPTADERTLVTNFLESDDIQYACYGNEVGNSGTPHLQGFLILKRAWRLRRISRALGGRCHLEIARGTSVQARDYCLKDGDNVEFGEFPNQSGKRNDIQALIEWGDAFAEANNGRAPSSPEIARDQPEAYLRYPRFTRLCERRSAPRALQFGEANEWQQALETVLNGPADDRTIHFYIDDEGGKGKTWFARYYLTKYPEKTQILSAGRRDDIAHALDPQKNVFLFNLPRNGLQFFQYTIVEQIKDRIVFSPKYNSTTKTWIDNNHVVVFCNEKPDMNAMSNDRYVIHEL